MPWLGPSLSSFTFSMHSLTERLLKVLDIRLALQAICPRELLLAQYMKVAVALSTSEQPTGCMHEPVRKTFCI